MITHRLPYAPNRGDRQRSFHEIRFLRELGWQIDILALVHDRAEAAHVHEMRAVGQHVEIAPVPWLLNRLRGLVTLPGTRPLTLTLLDSPELKPAVARLVRDGLPDVVLAFSSSSAPIAMAPPLADVPRVLDFIDVDSEKWRQLSKTSRWPMSWIYRREYRTLREFERVAAMGAHVTLVTTEREREALLAIAPEARVEVLRQGIDLGRYQRPAGAAASGPRVVFTGVMNYGPNAEAAIWLAREIWTLVRVRCPDARLDIVGASPTAAVEALHDPSRGVTVTGSVPDVRPYLWNARVAAAPLRVARGIQNKVLEAAAAGLPCVVTSAVRAGLPGPLHDHCPVADTPLAFADALADLLDRPADTEAWASLVADVNWATSLRRLPVLLQEAATSR